MTLFHGEEEFLRRSGVEMIREADPDFSRNALRVSSSETTWPGLLSELCTPPFLGGRKFVVLVDEGNFVHNESANLKAYVRSPSPSAVLVILASANKCPVSFDLKNMVTVSCRSLKPADALRWVQAAVQRAGKSIERDALDLLVRRTGADLAVIEGAIESIFLYMGKRDQILVRDVELLVGDDSEAKIYELTIATSRKDGAGALRILHTLMEGGEASGALLWRLAWQYRKMTEAKRLLGAGVRRMEVASRLQITYYQDKFLSSVEAHAMPELLEKHQAILDADLALKSSGSGVDEAILDSLVCRLAASEANATV